MLFSRAFALSCDNHPHGQVGRTGAPVSAFLSPPPRLRSVARGRAVVQQDRGDPRRAERARAAESAAERHAGRRLLVVRRRSLPPTRPTGRGFRSVSRSPRGQPRRRQRPPRHLRHRCPSRRPHAARCALAQVEHAPVGGTAARFAESLRGKDRSSGSRRSTGTSTSASASSTIRSQYGRADVWSAASETLHARPRRLRGLSRSPSCRCCAAPDLPTGTSIW